MKKALISPNEKIYDYNEPPNVIGCRVAQIEDNAFEISLPLYWIDCADDIIADVYYYDDINNIIVKKPENPVVQEILLNFDDLF